MAARIFLGLFGLLTIPYGLFCFAQPGFLEAFAGVAATSTTGTIEIRAMYGGLQTGFGALALFGALRPEYTRVALVATAFLLAGTGTFRLMSAVAASELSPYSSQALLFELGATALTAFFISRLPRTPDARAVR